MRRACEVIPAGAWNEASAVDCIALDAHERHRRRIVLNGERGTRFMLDLPRAAALHDGDGLLLDDGAIIRVTGHPESLVEIRASNPQHLARLAWHIGNRHVDVQIEGERLRIRRDHVIEDMLRGLGAMLSPVEAPFHPEHGAYAHDDAHSQAHSHGHDHGHGHDHQHDHDDGS